jgi:hypothetical protein
MVGGGRGGVQECSGPEECAEEKREMAFFVEIAIRGIRMEPLTRMIPWTLLLSILESGEPFYPPEIHTHHVADALVVTGLSFTPMLSSVSAGVPSTITPQTDDFRCRRSSALLSIGHATMRCDEFSHFWSWWMPSRVLSFIEPP